MDVISLSSSAPHGATSLSSLTLTNATNESPLLEETEDLTMFVILIFVVLLPLSLLIIIGNSLVIIAVYSSPLLRERFFYYVVGSMAANDMVVGFLIIPVYYIGIWVTSAKESLYGCMSMVGIFMVSSMASILHVLLIAIDRYVAVFYSLEYFKIVTRRRILVAIAAVWVYVLSFNLLPYVGWRKQNPTLPLAYCFTDQIWTPSLICFQCVSSLLTPLCIMVGIYTRVVRAALAQARRVDAQQEFVTNAERSGGFRMGRPSIISGDNSTSEPRKTEAAKARIGRKTAMFDLKATKTSAIVLGTFLICWLPGYAIHIVFTFVNSDRAEPLHTPTVALLQAWSNLLPFLSSSANPVIYAFRYKDFRESFKRSLKFSFCHRRE